MLRGTSDFSAHAHRRWLGHVSFWHYSEVPARLAYVGYRGKTGKHLLAVSFIGFDPQRS
jgi:hypothetical protein